MLTLDASKAARELGWNQRLGIEETLRQTVVWYDAWRSAGDLRALSEAQTDAFMAELIG